MADEKGGLFPPKEQESILQSIEAGNLTGVLKELTSEFEQHLITVSEYRSALRSLANEQEVKVKSLLENQGKLIASSGQFATTLIGMSESGKAFADGLMSISKSLASAIPGMTGQILGATVGVADAFRQAYDSTVTWNREIMQAGLQSSSLSGSFNQSKASIMAAGEAFGFAGKESAGMALSLTKAGFVGEDLGTSIKVIGALNKGFGVEVQGATRLVTQFGTTLGLHSEDVTGAFAEVTKAGRGSALGVNRYIQELSTLIDQSKIYGSDLSTSTVGLSSFSGALKAGIMSLDNVIHMTNASSQSFNQLALITEVVRGTKGLEGLAKELKLGTDLEENTNLLMLRQGDGTKAYTQAVFEAGHALSGNIRSYKVISEYILPLVGVSGVNAAKALEFFKSGDFKGFEEFMAGVKAKSKAEDPMTIATGAFSSFKTSAERFAPAANKFADAVYEWGKQLGLGKSEEMGTSGHFIQEYMASVKEVPGALKQLSLMTLGDLGNIIKDGFSKLPEPQVPTLGGVHSGRIGGKASGGMVPTTDYYLMHAGEMVSRPGESTGGGITINMGGLSVTAGDSGSVRGQVDDAFSRMKDQVMRELETMWRAAAGAS